MSNRKPLVLADDRSGTAGQPVIQQLQSVDQLDIPLESRVANLEGRLAALATSLLQMGLEIPPNLLEVP